ncbi:MAG: hypothetical protein AMXMBFR48_23860 [Ignavibacteriales bacterium]
MPGDLKNKGKKLKVGTVLDEQIYQQLKKRAVKEGRTISDVIQEAIVAYNAKPVIDIEARKKALRRFSSNPFDLTRQDLEELMALDYYEQ